jgi:hypothetical protein
MAPYEVTTKGWLFDYGAWGGDWWRVIHGATLRYPEHPDEADKLRIKAFLGLVPVYMPCASCSLNFLNELKQQPLTDEVLSSGPKLVQWGVDLHNSVNRRLGKPEVTMDQMHAFFYLDVRNEPRAAQRKQPRPGCTASHGTCPGPEAEWQDFVDHTANLHKADEQQARQQTLMPAALTAVGCVGLLLAVFGRSQKTN